MREDFPDRPRLRDERHQPDVAAAVWALKWKLLPHPGQEFRPGNPRGVVRAGLLMCVRAAVCNAPVVRLPTGRGITQLADIPDGERRNRPPQLVIRRESAVIPMPVLPRRRHEIGEPVEELKRRGVRTVEVERYDDESAMAAVLDGVECVVHAAARAHVMSEDAADPMAAFREANVFTTVRLARQAPKSGVRRFVFLSSIGVNGEATTRPFTQLDPPMPASPYAVAKHEAEQALATVARETDPDVVIVRPPLVTGPGAPGNFGRLVRLARSGVPLPLGGISNKRSVVGIGNLCDFLVAVGCHPAASNQTFLVADPQDISTSDMIAALRRAMELPPQLVAMPSKIMTAVMNSMGRGRLTEQLYGDLQVSAAHARQRLGWIPCYDTIEGFAAAVRLEPRRVL